MSNSSLMKKITTWIAVFLIVSLFAVFNYTEKETFAPSTIVVAPVSTSYPDASYFAENNIKYSLVDFEPTNDTIADSIYLWKVACTNLQYLSYYCYRTDAGGSTEIADTLRGELTSQDVYIQYYGNSFRQHINYITEAQVLGKQLDVVESIAHKTFDVANQSLRFENMRYSRNGAQWSFDVDTETLSAEWGTISGYESKYHSTALLSTGELPEGFDVKDLSDARTESNINYDYPDIIESASYSLVTDEASGQNYYAVKMVINVEAANSDNDYSDKSSMMGKLKDTTGAEEGVHYGLFELEFEVWECGLMKMWASTESWVGTFKVSVMSFSGATQSYAPYNYSYSLEDALRIYEINEEISALYASE